MLSRFSHVRFFAVPWTVASQLFCPWDSPGKNTAVGCHALLQGIFLPQGWKLSPLSCINRQGGSLPLLLLLLLSHFSHVQLCVTP